MIKHIKFSAHEWKTSCRLISTGAMRIDAVRILRRDARYGSCPGIMCANAVQRCVTRMLCRDTRCGCCVTMLDSLMFTYHRKKGSQHSRNALIMMPRVRAAFLSRRIVVMVDCSTWMLGRGFGIWLICRCFSRSSAATFDLNINLPLNGRKRARNTHTETHQG